MTAREYNAVVLPVLWWDLGEHMLKAYKRLTVEFFHEVDGKLKTGSLDFVKEANTGVAYQRDAFESHIVEVLKELGLINPRFAGIYNRFDEPPFFLI